ncbi:unnamed protein product [Sphagnum jensenii]|uniref:40S ribosomal protein S25 n=1 Tax=Sphagnum jensenii TaxID=128206 RepID=A0ABP1B3L8_9BRYO
MCIISVIRVFPLTIRRSFSPLFRVFLFTLTRPCLVLRACVPCMPLFFFAPKKEKAAPSSKPAKSSGGGGKQKKKKWSKGKQKEKVNNMVLFDQATYDKLLVEVPKYKLITPSVLSDRLRISGSLARRAIKELMAKGTIRLVAAHANQQIYTRATNT